MKKILNNLKNDSALTIVEVLVAVILTAIVMLHGTGFFIVTWRLSAESREYNLILNDAILNLERCQSAATTAVKADGFSAPDSEYVILSRNIRGNTVTYSLRKTNMGFVGGHIVDGYWFLTSMAEWRYAGDKHSSRRINIRTAYVPGDGSNPIYRTWIN